ncbi:hemerythrin domain-containing protein [Streptomyces sp. A7024]|uniref:Hemerythrin domain-containing protein n=2 Tax=Streptomyces coryli TaxID=1128680 RepID=A0A6G4TWA3_9ACTN|nr:hemerythrin domain-containing protein [Streptomyces coryli]NGN64164.1 hemerythrin domain-containing protein [Streptomyces coryli]
MCHYCGCREIPLIKEFIAEHDQVKDLAGDAERAFDRGETARVRELVRAMATILQAHWRGEEDGLFAVMRGDPEYADYIAALMREHRELAELLDTADPDDAADRKKLFEAFDELHHHIAKEEDGLFPASLTALSGEEWNRSIAAWRAAHPDRDPDPDEAGQLPG